MRELWGRPELPESREKRANLDQPEDQVGKKFFKKFLKNLPGAPAEYCSCPERANGAGPGKAAYPRPPPSVSLPNSP